MATGIRAEIRIETPSECPVAQFSAKTGASSHSVSKTAVPSTDGQVTVEFVATSNTDLEEIDVGVELTEVFQYGSESAYRFDRKPGATCPCACVESFGCPVIDVRAREGSLYLTFHAPDMTALQEVIGDLRERYSGLDVRRLLRSQEEYLQESLVFVDRSALTDRQREVLETAHEMGYFDHPKEANAGEVATALDITTSTFTEHLSAAQRKLLGSVIDA